MIKKKLQSQSGFSFTELLVALAILSVMTLGMAVGISASMRIYNESTALSDAQSLSSTLSIAIMDELRFARDVQEGDNPTFTSQNYGVGVALATNAQGHVTLGGYPLLSTATYTGLTAKLEKVSYHDNQFDVKLAIQKDTTTIKTIQFSVTPINESL